MVLNKSKPVNTIENLRDRVDRLFKTTGKSKKGRSQRSLDLLISLNNESTIDYPTKNISEFLNFITDAIPDGDVFLFGGLLRDMALLGRKGFNSDIDIVVEGSWNDCVTYLESLGAHKNKFGGYRLQVDKWPVDIWNAEETWAIKQGLVQYDGIASLTETTVLNWDAILMNWRTRVFICRPNYLDEIKTGVMDMVLEQNPDPLGMAVRVFRHLCMKEAKSITSKVTKYLANCAKTYSFDEIKNREVLSYGKTVINPNVYGFFGRLKEHEYLDIHSRTSVVNYIVKEELGLD